MVWGTLLPEGKGVFTATNDWAMPSRLQCVLSTFSKHSSCSVQMFERFGRRFDLDHKLVSFVRPELS